GISYDHANDRMNISANGSLIRLNSSLLFPSTNGSIGLGTQSTRWANAYISGVVQAVALSGSLTNLDDGTSYLIAGNNVEITSQSNGSVEIAISTSIPSGSGTDNHIVRWDGQNDL